MSTRILGVVGLVGFLFLAQVAAGIEAPFNYEPVGPRAWPLLLCGLGAAFSAALALRGDARAVDWPRGPLAARTLLAAAALLGLAFAFEPLGFPLAAGLASVALGRAFAAPWRGTVAVGVATGALGWLAFDRLLDVTLPLGVLAPLFRPVAG